MLDSYIIDEAVVKLYNTVLSANPISETLVSERSIFPHIVFSFTANDSVGCFGLGSVDIEELTFEVFDSSKSNVGQIIGKINDLFHGSVLDLTNGGLITTSITNLGMIRMRTWGPKLTQLRNAAGDYIYHCTITFRCFDSVEAGGASGNVIPSPDQTYLVLDV